MNISFKYIKKHIAEHPISYRYVVLYPFLGAAFLASLFSLMILNNFYPNFAKAVISENLAPLTFEILCYIGLSYLTIRVVRKGLIEDLKNEEKKMLCFHVPSTAIGIKATYSGIVLGAVFAVIISFDTLPAPLSYSTLFSLCFQNFLLTSAIYLFFILITVTPTTAPNYKKKNFLSVLKALCLLLAIAATGRFLLLLALAADQLEKAT